MRKRFTEEQMIGILKEAEAGLKVANLCSLIETRKANDIGPYQYVIKLFGALPLATTVDDYEALLPGNLPAEFQ